MAKKKMKTDKEIQDEFKECVALTQDDMVRLEAEYISMHVVQSIYDLLKTKDRAVVAKALEIPENEVYQYRVGDKILDLKTIAKWARKLDADIYILCRERT